MDCGKTFVLCFLILCAFDLSAQKKTTGPTKAELDASKIITLTNSIIDLSNAQMKELDNYKYIIEEGDRKAESLKKNYDPKFSVSFGRGSYQAQPGYHVKYEDALKASPVFKTKSDITTAVKKADQNVDTLVKWGLATRNYFINKEFEKDKDFTGYKVIRDSLTTYLDMSRKSWRKAVKLASDAGDDAEAVLLKKSPLAEFIIPMKSDLNSLKDIVNEIYATADDSSDFSALKGKLSTLQASLEKNKSTKGKNVSALSHESYYTDFYEKSLKCASTTGTLLELLSKKDADEDKVDNGFSKLSMQYKDVINSYNNFAGFAAK